MTIKTKLKAGGLDVHHHETLAVRSAVKAATRPALIAAVAALALPLVAYGGRSIQGASWNGSLFQGSVLQGWGYNGLPSNGISFNGIAVQGLAFNGSELTGVVAGKLQPLPAGTLLQGQFANGGTVALRIDGREQDASSTLFDDPGQRSNQDVTLYAVSFQEPQDGGWRPLCAGDEKALFLEGVWDPQSGWRPSAELFSVSCTNGALAKCVRWGYKPWKTVPGKGGKPVELRDLHQACVRAARADYCGDGVSYTADGTLIDLWDAYGLIGKTPEEQSEQGFSAEASFGTAGAGCIEQARYAERQPRCSEPRLQRFASSTPSSALGDPDDRVPCVRRQNAGGQPQILFTESSTYCPHPPTVAGASLHRDCSACTRKVCSADRHCCGLDPGQPAAWDDPCVERARKLCR
jgi:hypothetical protein